MKKDVVVMCAIIILILLGVGGAFAYLQQSKPAATTAQSSVTPATSTEGSSTAPVTSTTPVPPPVPTGHSYGTTTLALGEKAQIADITVAPLSIEEDSRCPLGVMCIQAGTVRVSTRIGTYSGSLTQILSLNKPFTIGTESITLVGVQPIKRIDTTIAPSDYQLTFDIEKL